MKPTVPVMLHIILLSFYSTPRTAGQPLLKNYDSICHVQIVSDALFQSAQRIHLLILDKDLMHEYSFDLAYRTSELIKTSQFAENRHALAAVNGSFFDMDRGGSVSYFEINDSVISRNKNPDLKWAVPDSLINGALIFDKKNLLEIEPARLQEYYEHSKTEHFVMVSGPLLIKDAAGMRLPDMPFTHTRHPRTCVGITEEHILLITIDGRSESAAGMTLNEAQEFLLRLGCLDAINLDGGGSTCMWIKDEGLVNIPSDKSGERAVANALLILKR